MLVLFRIALRNLKEHRSKTLIIGFIIMIGIAVLLLGNTMMATAIQGLQRMFIKNYSGHIIITGQTSEELSLFGYQSFSKIGESLPIVPDVEKIIAFLKSDPRVAAYTLEISSRAFITTENRDNLFINLTGVDPATYREIFTDNLTLVSGNFLQPGQQGIVLSQDTYDRLQKQWGLDIKVGDKLLVSNIPGQSGVKIRSLEVVGIFKFNNSNMILDRTSFIDAENHRLLAGLTVGSILSTSLDPQLLEYLKPVDESKLFGESLWDSDSSLLTPGNFSSTEAELFRQLDDTQERSQLLMPLKGSWNFILVRLKDGGELTSVRHSIDNFIQKNNLAAQTSTWLEAAGAMAKISFSVQGAFNIIVFIVAIVAVIIIMNTLVVSILERTGEIGTMRTLGAQKGYIRMMILIETLVISLVFGTLGVVLGVIIIGILNFIGIPAPNMFVQIIFGGKVLYPVLSWKQITDSFLLIALIGFVSSYYPSQIALRIKPLSAMGNNH